MLRAAALCCLLGAGWHAAARADVPEYDGSLKCDAAGNRALVVFETNMQTIDVPAEIASAFAQASDAGGECTLADGRAVKLKTGSGSGKAYGMCGGDPGAYFSLWIDRRKVMGPEMFVTCEQGLGRVAIALIGDRLTDCQVNVPPDEQGDFVSLETPRTVACVDISAALTANPVDAIEYPPIGPERPPVGTVLVTEAEDRAFCEGFIQHDPANAEPRIKHGQWWDGDADGLDFLKGGGETTPAEKGSGINGAWATGVSKFDIDNDGSSDDVLANAQTNNVLDGAFFVLVPPTGPPAQEIAQLAAKVGDPDRFIAEMRHRGIAVYSGAATAYENAYRVTIFPITVSGTTYLWAIGEDDTLLGALYRPGPQGKMQQVCRYERVTEHF